MSDTQTMAATDDHSGFTVSERAARQIALISAKEPQPIMLRITVEGGGCSGFQYKFDLVTSSRPDDLIFEKAGSKVVIDEMSLQYMSGSQIDYVDDLIGASFQIQNPNATASCGCGTSFSL